MCNTCTIVYHYKNNPFVQCERVKKNNQSDRVVQTINKICANRKLTFLSVHNMGIKQNKKLNYNA